METDSIEKILIQKFLEKNFPTHRLKVNQRFKRAIALEDGIYLISDKESTNQLYFKLLDILSIVFSFERTMTELTLKDFLNIR